VSSPALDVQTGAARDHRHLQLRVTEARSRTAAKRTRGWMLGSQRRIRVHKHKGARRGSCQAVRRGCGRGSTAGAPTGGQTAGAARRGRAQSVARCSPAKEHRARREPRPARGMLGARGRLERGLVSPQRGSTLSTAARQGDKFSAPDSGRPDYSQGPAFWRRCAAGRRLTGGDLQLRARESLRRH